jgi:hypothetical protein
MKNKKWKVRPSAVSFLANTKDNAQKKGCRSCPLRKKFIVLQEESFSVEASN